MKLFYNSIFSLVTLTMAMLLAQCSNNEIEPLPADQKQLTVSLVTTAPKESSTRAGEVGDYDNAENENAIRKVDVFFYQGETQVWYAEQTVYDVNSKKAVIAVPSSQEALFDRTQSYDVYIVVNGPSRAEMEGKSLADLKNVVLTPSNTGFDFSLTNRKSNPAQFVMDGMLAGKAVSLASPHIGTVDLARAASKIRIRILKGEKISQYIPTDGTSGATPLISVKNYNTRGALMKGRTAVPETYHSDADYTPADVFYMPSLKLPGISHPYPIYSYEKDWSTDRSKETYVMVRVPLKVPAGASEFTYYYYKVPVNFQKPEGPQNDVEKDFYRLKRNHLYDIEVFINKLGGTVDNPVELTGNYVIQDWTTQQVAVAIAQQHYLFVSPQTSKMQNVTTTVLSYASSKLPITISNIAASYTYTDAATGKVTTIPYNPANVTVYPDQPAMGQITVTSTIPTNNVPKDISFTVSNGITALNQVVKITQYPANYITDQQGIASNLRTGFTPGDGLNNKAMYIITANSPDGTSIIGFPPLDANGYTSTAAEVSNLVSPSFQLASQLGATQPSSFTSAQQQCANYWEETVVNGITVRYTDWRLPTDAEIALVDKMQNQTGSVVKSIMTGKYYWDSSNITNGGAHIMTGGSGGSSSSAYVRCVRDVKN
ncbi:Hypothetical protein PEIBARAKI_6026 [Petrimonas sp. IBARAKI]|nr:Hypothetical protein PEIBARAKI_6026 [Petrimonas sp. IBARAKI]